MLFNSDALCEKWRMALMAVTQVCMLLQDVNCGPPVSFWPDISWQGWVSVAGSHKREDASKL